MNGYDSESCMFRFWKACAQFEKHASLLPGTDMWQGRRTNTELSSTPQACL